MVAHGPVSDDFAVGAVDLRPPQRDPGGEGGVQLLDGGEGPPGQDVVTDDVHLPLDPALALGPVGGQHVDVEVVVSGEGDRLRVRRDCLAGGDVPAHDRLGAVVDDAHRHPSNMRVSMSSPGAGDTISLWPSTGPGTVRQGFCNDDGGRCERSLAVRDVPQGVLQQPAPGPSRRPPTVQAENLGEHVKAASHHARRVTLRDDVVPPAVQGWPQVEAGISGERLGVNGEPRLALRGEDVAVVQVSVEDPVAGFADQFCQGRGPAAHELLAAGSARAVPAAAIP